MSAFFSNPIYFPYFIFILLGVLLIIYGIITKQKEKRNNVLSYNKSEKNSHSLLDNILNKIDFIIKKETEMNKTLDVLRIEKYTARKITKLRIACGMISILLSITLKNFLVMFPLMFIFCNIPNTLLNIKLQKRLKEYNNQILESFQLFISDYTTTQSVQKSITNICPKIKKPLRYEYERLSRQLNSGADIRKSFEEFETRTQNKWTLIFSKLIINYFEKGGNFVPHLINITKSITTEKILKSQNHTELSSVRIVNICLNLLIPVCYISNKFINPQDSQVFVNTPTGRTIMFFIVLSSCISLYLGHKLSES